MRARTRVAVLPLLVALTASAVFLVLAVVLVASADADQATTWNFNSTPVGSIPANCVTPTGGAPIPATDVMAPAGDAQSVVLKDPGNALPLLRCSGPATASASLTFQVYPQAMPNGFNLDLIGGSTSGPQGFPLVHVLFAANGSVQWYNGSSWQTVAGAGGPAVGRWSTVTLSVGVGTNQVSVSVNGAVIGSAGTWLLNPLTYFSGFQFSGYGATSTGDAIYFATPTLDGTAPVTAMWWNFDGGGVGTIAQNCGTPPHKAAVPISDTITVPGSAHSVHLSTNGSTQSVLQCAATPGYPGGPGGNLRFTVYPRQLANGFMVDLRGASTSGVQANPVFHLLFRSNGSVAWYEGYDATNWMPLAARGGPAVGQWSTVEIGTTADMGMVYVRVNGQYLGSGGSWTLNSTTAISGFQFDGYGSAATGDDIYFGSPGLFPALSVSPTQTERKYWVGSTTMLANASTSIQMPSGVVQVPGPNGGRRLIGDYATHPDTSTGTGNTMVSSADGGVTWAGVTNNPMPNVPTINLTRLTNGSVLATGFHTYNNLGGTASNASQAVVETAVSTDNGQTWSAPRFGIASAPQALGPYKCEVPSGCKALFFFGHSVQDASGAIYQAAYGRYNADPAYGWHQYVLVSRDDGVSWNVQGSIAGSSGSFPHGFAEGALAWTDGTTMIAVMRTGSYQPLYLSRSTDSGATWSTPAAVIGSDGSVAGSIAPCMATLGDQSLLLLTGRPGVSLLRSRDNGQTWSQQTWIDYNDSGNATMAVTGGGSVVVLGDRGPNWLNPQTYGIWSKSVSLTLTGSAGSRKAVVTGAATHRAAAR